MKKIDSLEAIKRIKRIFSRFGLPLSITADNGRQFVRDEFKEYFRTNNIELINTMFNRNIRDKLPSILQLSNIDNEVRDQDAMEKWKGKCYADSKRHAKVNDVEEGDDVIMKRQVVTNKLATTFEPMPYKVIERKGSKVTVQNPNTGTEYRRNVAHVKKVPAGIFKPTIPSSNRPDSSEQITRSSKRKRAMPNQFLDYDLSEEK